MGVSWSRVDGDERRAGTRRAEGRDPMNRLSTLPPASPNAWGMPLSTWLRRRGVSEERIQRTLDRRFRYGAYRPSDRAARLAPLELAPGRERADAALLPAALLPAAD